MKRYDITPGGGIEEHDRGTWVRYVDVRRLETKLDDIQQGLADLALANVERQRLADDRKAAYRAKERKRYNDAAERKREKNASK